MLVLRILLLVLACHQAVEGRSALNFLKWLKDLAVDPKLLVPYIVNGMESPRHMFNYQVGLSMYREDGSRMGLCGGSLITREWVLTAGHCLQMPGERRASYVQVLLGAHMRYEDEPTQQRIKSKELIIHPQFIVAPPAHDIALIKLEKPAALNYYVNTIRLPDDETKTYLGHPVRVSGWGDTESGRGALELRFVETKVEKDEVCKKDLMRYGDTNICASGLGNKGSASGDSGGPMTAYDQEGNPILVGVCSYGHRFGAVAGKPTAYTRVTKLLPWIKQYVKDL